MRVGLVGAGAISEIHLACLTRSASTEIVGIADIDAERARTRADRHGVAHIFPDLDDLLSGQEPDVVHVLTPPHTHQALAVAALRAGAHVYLEKPMALTDGECGAIEAAAAEAGRQVCVGHCLLYDPLMQRARQLIDSGSTGEVLHVAVSFGYDVRRNPALGTGHWTTGLPGGLLEDLSFHPISLLLGLLGEPRSVHSATRRGDMVHIDKDEELAVLIDGERGMGTMVLSLGAQPHMFVMDIWCTRMRLRLNFGTMVLTTERPSSLPAKIAKGVSSFDLAAQLVTKTTSAVWRVLRKKADTSMGICPLIAEFHAALGRGDPAPVDGAQGRTAVRIVRSIWPMTQDPGDSR